MIGPDGDDADVQEDKNGEKGKTFLWVFRTKSDLLDSTKHLANTCVNIYKRTKYDKDCTLNTPIIYCGVRRKQP